MTDLRKLARPFPGKFIHSNPSGGGSYVKHHVVNQRLLMDVGPFDFSLVEIVRGMVPGRPPNPNGNSARAKSGTPDLPAAVVGVVARLTVTIDGQHVTVEEAGDCEEPNNWPHDGARMKDAMSDAFKRCAMRLGLGLHLWSQDEFFLDVELGKREQDAVHPGSAEVGGGTAAPRSDRSTAAGGQAAPETPPAASPPFQGGADGDVPPAVPPSGVDPETGEIDTPEKMTPQQNRLMFALLNGTGITDDDAQRAAIGAVLDRTVESRGGLSKQEATKVIKALKDQQKQGTSA